MKDARRMGFETLKTPSESTSKPDIVSVKLKINLQRLSNEQPSVS